ncbi:CopG family transcriptional regulator, partial [Escherichia coli]|nr:CopG family transcriptional regulator [Escherichia coli]
MRTLIDIEEKQITALDKLATKRNVSRAALVREAVARFLESNAVSTGDAAFGLWGNREDG